MAEQYWIVWNADRSEGFVTASKEDAETAFNGDHVASCSIAAIAFYEANDHDDDNFIERVTISPGHA